MNVRNLPAVTPCPVAERRLIERRARKPAAAIKRGRLLLEINSPSERVCASTTSACGGGYGRRHPRSRHPFGTVTVDLESDERDERADGRGQSVPREDVAISQGFLL